VFVLVLGAFGVWWVLKKDDSSSRSVAASTTTTRETTTSRATRTTTTANPDSFDARLLAVLPASYDDGACEPAHRRAGHR
jgi:serine/threonine-protein kinase